MKVAVRVGLEAAAGVSERDIPVVIDVLRASSTICQALKNGAKGIITVDTPKKAKAVKKKNGDVLLCGEQNAERLKGFDLSNSPLEYTPELVKGKTLVLVTTNCTKALELLGGQVFIGCLNNATAVAQTVEKLAKKEDKDVILIPVGMGADFGMEDWIAAGIIARSIHELEKDHHTVVAEKSSMIDSERMHELLMSTPHAQRLLGLGYEKDLDFCLKKDITDVVPVRTDGVIRKWSIERV
jgi:2-phosphosulfolactate phosphatase